ncbi:acyl-CoA N-acyltransferase [Xylariaceae sp. FL1272]|nr:acyl-CoA N-acyltransferase [Xylariaceae sp. FL1272]
MDSMTEYLQNAFRTERLIMRHVENNEKDKDFIAENFFNDTVNRGFASDDVPRPFTKSISRPIIEQSINSYLPIMMCLPTDAGTMFNLVGSASNSHRSINTHPIGVMFVHRKEYRRMTCSIQIAAEYQNQGYGREALNWVIEYAFRSADMNRFEIAAFSYNERALRLYRSVGLVEEGVARNLIFMNGDWHDVHKFAVLASEWWLRQAELVFGHAGNGSSRPERKRLQART